MTFEEEYLTLVGHVGNFTKGFTGTDIVDAYFGPKEFSRSKAGTHPPPEKLLMDLDLLIEKTKDVDEELRRIAIRSDLESLKVVVKWISGEDIPYLRLVEGIFGITPRKFQQNEIQRAQEAVEPACATLPGSSVSEKILRWREESKISGETLKKLIDTEIVPRTEEIETLFKKKVFAHLPAEVENKGIIYKTVSGEPWGAYNYYQGNYTSVNVFNLDRSFNKYGLTGTVCHEYEHHVAALFMEKCYRERGYLDLSAFLLMTKNCIISEGTAECAGDFLDLQLDKYGELVQALRQLGDMVTLNVAYMLNVEGVDFQTAAEYIASEIFVPIEETRKALAFSRPLTPDGKPNLFKPYIYTYFFGRRDYVLPTFQKAQRRDKLGEFFQTLYLNPYSRSTATWERAFSEI